MAARLGFDLPTWTELNARLGKMKTEAAVLELQTQLRLQGANARWLRRAQARFRQLRKLRERREFERGLAAYRGPRRKGVEV